MGKPLLRTTITVLHLCLHLVSSSSTTDRLHLKFSFSRRNRRSRPSLFPVNKRRRRELRCGS